MAKRIPEPNDVTRPRLVLSAAELQAVEDAAHQCRLSVASFLRVLVVEAMRHADARVEAWREVAAELSGGGEEEVEPQTEKRPRGRPPKKPKGE